VLPSIATRRRRPRHGMAGTRIHRQAAAAPPARPSRRGFCL